ELKGFVYLFIFNFNPSLMRTLLLSLLCLSCLISCTPKYGVVYLSNASGNFDLFLTDTKGKKTQQLSTNPGMDWSAQWDAAHEQIVYNSSDTSGTFAIRAMSRSGQPKPLNTFEQEEFVVSPDGQYALFTTRDGDNRYIQLISRKGGEKKKLIDVAAYNGRPNWSPDSQTFSFISDRSGSNELYLYRMDNAATTQLTTNQLREKYTSWLPDSKTIIYTASDDPDGKRNNLYRVKIDTKKSTNITNDELLYEEISVSPDGRLIVYHGKVDGADHLFLMNIDGSGKRQLTTAKAYHGEPKWIPLR
ncbi:MAG: DPP IV N-terminal domain-containing protein, partial [Bacteroidota bacterium]